MEDEYKQEFLPAVEKYATMEEVRALIANSKTSITSPLTVKSSYMQSEDFTTGSRGWQIKANGDVEFNDGYFRGDLTGATGTFSGTVNIGSLNIPDATTANSAHTDATGNSWWGCNVASFVADHDNAPAYILSTGEIKGQNITLEGMVIIKDLQAGSVIDGQYVNSLAVGKLVSGSILSKTVTLGVTGGSGDAYINSGKTDFTNTQSGFILGVDDSDSDTAKFFIGDADKYLNWDGDNLDITASRQLEPFTAGEAITAGDSLCLGRGCYDHDRVESVELTRSAGVSSYEPDTNFQGSYLWLGANDTPNPDRFRWVLIDFDFENFSDVFTTCLSWTKCSSAGLPGGGYGNIDFYPITSEWNPATVTYNTLPTLGTGITGFSVNQSDGSIYHSADLTEFMWKIKAGLTTAPYGFLLKIACSAVGDYGVNFFTTQAADEPWIGGRRMVYKDKVFRAKSAIIEGDSQEYRCFNFIGFAAEAADADTTIRVITQGTVSSGLTTLIPGETYYVGEGAGGIDTSYSISSNKPLYKIGTAISTTKLMIEKGEKTWDFVLTEAKANPYYHPTYFKPIEMEVWTGGTSGFEEALLGRYINKNQYIVGYNMHTLTTGELGFGHIDYLLPGGIVFSYFSADTISLIKMKG